MRRKSLGRVLLLAAVLAVTGICGCERPARSGLVLWTDMVEMDTIRGLCREFEDLSGVPVKIVRVPFEELQPKFQVAAPVRQGPDLITGPHDWIGPFATAGIIEPLALSKQEIDAYVSVALQVMAFGGKQYGLPLSLETLCLVYNKDLVKEPPQTMDDLIRMAGSLTGRDRNGFLFEVFDFYFAFPFFSGYGGYIFKDTLAGPDEKDLGLANEGSVKAARLLLDLQKKYRLIPPGLRKDVINGRFLDGKVAMTIAGPWSLTDYKKKKMNYGVCRIPRLDNGRWPSPLVGVTGVMMSATSSRPKDAIALMKHISGKEAQVAIYKAGGRTPTRKDAINDPAVSGDRDVKAIQDQASVGTPMPNIPALTQVWTPMIEALQLISTEQQTPEEALRDAQARTLKNIELMMK